MYEENEQEQYYKILQIKEIYTRIWWSVEIIFLFSLNM